jgi:hypothetical protein
MIVRYGAEVMGVPIARRVSHCAGPHFYID